METSTMNFCFLRQRDITVKTVSELLTIIHAYVDSLLTQWHESIQFEMIWYYELFSMNYED